MTEPVAPDDPLSEFASMLPKTRGYQQEMLDESLRRNIIIALDTGSGKTHIAILRMKVEAEREPKKISWFLAPTVVLCEQQRTVIAGALPVPVGLISGALEPNQWKDAKLWNSVLIKYRIMVSTPQVLLDALRHGYINLGRDIGLLIFDEAHHAVGNDPYRMIMEDHYRKLDPRALDGRNSSLLVRPMILGLTASPIFSGDVSRSFQIIEYNLDCTIRAPRIHRTELESFVHRPKFTHVLYASNSSAFASNLASLEYVQSQINIEDDPYVISLRKKLTVQQPNSAEYLRTDQELSKTIRRRSTFTLKAINAFCSAANAILIELGAWATDWYIYEVLKLTQRDDNQAAVAIMSSWTSKEKAYLLSLLGQVTVTPVSYHPDDIVEECSPKFDELVNCLLREKAAADDGEGDGEPYSGLVFVQRRDVVLALAHVIASHPRTKDMFTVGCLLGTSDSSYRTSFIDITKVMLKRDQAETLTMFRNGDLNLVLGTAVAEEGLDVQACGSVVRWDPPPNMASWAQSRGRARRKKSTFTVMFEEGAENNVSDWEETERRMIQLYNDTARDLVVVGNDELEGLDDDYEEGDPFLFNEETGASLTLQSALPHLEHFCAVMPNASHAEHRPIYDLDPPEFKEGWHADSNQAVSQYLGPYGATVTLPRLLPPKLRVFSTERVHRTKVRARRHAAFLAYSALYREELLAPNFLPLTSVVEPKLEETVKALLAEVEKRASTASVSLQMDVWTEQDIDSEKQFWQSTLHAVGLPPMHLFTKSQLPGLEGSDAPVLYRSSREHLQISLYPGQLLAISDDTLLQARAYTSRLLLTVYGSRMDADNHDFAYLLLPVETDPLWDSRRSMAQYGDTLHMNAQLFGQDFDYPDDISVVRNAAQFAKLLRFVRWREETLTEEEMEQVRTLYERVPEDELELAMVYPLLEVEALPPRVNFLVPIPYNPRSSAKASPDRVVLLPGLSKVVLLSTEEMDYAFLLPSILRGISIKTTACSLRSTLFANSPALAAIPMHLITNAITAPIAGEHENYQRLETLGDTVLKFTASINILAEYPLWHEGYLSRKKDHAVSNARLAKEAVRQGLYRWIIRDRLVTRKWKPRYTETPISATTTTTDKPKPVSEMLSMKVLADVVESLMGSAYIHGGFDLGVECAALFGMGLIWKTVPVRVETLLWRVEKVDESMSLPSHLSSVEQMIGYTFSRKLLLVEALTHASHQGDVDFRTVSYERMEFLGDACLDMVVTDLLYHAPGKHYTPGDMFHRKAATVNADFLAYLCLNTHVALELSMPQGKSKGPAEMRPDGSQTIYLWQCLLHSSPVALDDLNTAFARYKKYGEQIKTAFTSGITHPWVLLTSLQAPKFLSDMVESILGAVFLDSGGSLDVVKSVLRKLGLMGVLERIVHDDVDVLHPKSRLGLWISKRHRAIEYVFEDVTKKTIKCKVLVDEEEIVSVTGGFRGKASKQELVFRAAEDAMAELIRREQEGVVVDKKRKRDSDEESEDEVEPEVSIDIETMATHLQTTEYKHARTKP